MELNKSLHSLVLNKHTIPQIFHAEIFTTNDQQRKFKAHTTYPTNNNYAMSMNINNM